MKNIKIGLLAICSLLLSYGNGQSFTLDELLHFTTFPVSKFQNTIAKKGFKLVKDGSDCMVYSNKVEDNKLPTRERVITKYKKIEDNIITVEGLNKKEAVEFKRSLSSQGFITYNLPTAESTIFQKENMTYIFLNRNSADSLEEVFDLTVEKRALPKSKDILFAEDLLQLNSHQYLTAVYGAKNVVKDVYISVAGNSTPCSVIFPNTASEAVFIWEDTINFRIIKALRIGGQSYTASSLAYERPIISNRWYSRQGIFSGMSLMELDKLNGSEINFYGWDWERGGTLTDDNKGNIDFKAISLVLSCFNCLDKNFTGDKVNNTKTALDQNKKIHVATFILYPSNR